MAEGDEVKPASVKTCDEMTFDEMVAWAKGTIVLSVGDGTFAKAVWLVVNQAWKRGYDTGIKEKKNAG